MIDTLVLVVYDRYDNLKKWFSILEKCERPKNIVVIHNSDTEYFEAIPAGVIYIPRKNTGFDIGAFQDVCRGRLAGFPDWDQLLWCTDDTFPMQPDFINKFALKPGE